MRHFVINCENRHGRASLISLGDSSHQHWDFDLICNLCKKKWMPLSWSPFPFSINVGLTLQLVINKAYRDLQKLSGHPWRNHNHHVISQTIYILHDFAFCASHCVKACNFQRYCTTFKWIISPSYQESIMCISGNLGTVATLTSQKVILSDYCYA